MRHLDLFSGIGGFAYAVDQVFGDVTHTFCDNEPFAQKVIKRHWPESKIYGDIREIKAEKAEIVTGGFPCQPFSHASSGRRGREDNRYLWPEMLRVIQLSQPAWVIAENVGGILTIEDGLVFEQVCLDLEANGYEVQPFIIPAVAVNAPHRRDRVWFVAYTLDQRRQRGFSETLQRQPARKGQSKGSPKIWAGGRPIPEPRTVGVDDGVPNRTHRIRALGNAIVPQVAMEIMRGMK